MVDDESTIFGQLRYHKLCTISITLHTNEGFKLDFIPHIIIWVIKSGVSWIIVQVQLFLKALIIMSFVYDVMNLRFNKVHV